MNTKLRRKGIMETISGREIDLRHFTEKDVDITDIAWALGRILRYNGHIRHNYYVAHHCIVASYAVQEQYALEALLHDAAEAYTGDLIYPFKSLWPEIEEMENSMVSTILDKFEVPHATKGWAAYEKSPDVAKVDVDLLSTEMYDMRGKGETVEYIERAWMKAIEEHGMFWDAPQFAFLQRFDALTGSSHFEKDGVTLNMELLEKWFPADAEIRKEEERKIAESPTQTLMDEAEEEEACSSSE